MLTRTFELFDGVRGVVHRQAVTTFDLGDISGMDFETVLFFHIGLYHFIGNSLRRFVSLSVL